METGTTCIYAAQPYIAKVMREKAAIVMLQEIQIPWRRNWKYPDYECYIAARNEIDLVADMDSDKVLHDRYNDTRTHITAVNFPQKIVFRPKHLLWIGINPEKKRCLNTWPMDTFQLVRLDVLTHEGERIP